MKSEKITEEERAWLAELERCFKRKPKTIEVMVEGIYSGSAGFESKVHILKNHVIFDSLTTQIDDNYDPSKYSLDYITVLEVAVTEANTRC
ncbi:TPA: hypothetical protein ACRZ4F_001585 [Vibrio harveyi]